MGELLVPILSIAREWGELGTACSLWLVAHDFSRGRARGLQAVAGQGATSKEVGYKA